ncbi:MAG: hypothetical protein C5B52_16335 [Bacteroidetes bacterium]|nr:MAG: hypothetical protein C5B52_16335 [Bacteroidota bacterium]
MQKTYRLFGFFIIFIFALVVWGFYRTYFGLFPSFKGVTTPQHFHGAMFLIWFAFLIVQPFLIHYNQIRLHRLIGKTSYVIAPLVAFSIFYVTKTGYERDIAGPNPPAQVIGDLSLGIPNTFVFLLFYILAMVNRKKTYFHMRYILGTALLLIGPGVGRILIQYAGMPFPRALNTVYAIEAGVAIILMIYDISKKNSYKPYLVIALSIGLLAFLFNYSDSAWWQAFGKGFAKIFF